MRAPKIALCEDPVYYTGSLGWSFHFGLVGFKVAGRLDIFSLYQKFPKSGRNCQKVARMTKDSRKYQIFLLTCGYFHFGPVVGFKGAGRLDRLPIPRGQSVIKQHWMTDAIIRIPPKMCNNIILKQKNMSEIWNGKYIFC